jgi:heptosyltransferase-2
MMFSKSFDKSRINKILVISLTNIGDVILTFPVIDVLRHDFPQAKLSLVIGPKAESLVKNNPHFEKVYIFDKHQPAMETFSWVMNLRKQHFDLVIDLRNTAIPFMIAPYYRTSWTIKRVYSQHMKEQHLKRFGSVYPYKTLSSQRYCWMVDNQDLAYVQDLFEKNSMDKNFVVVAPGAASENKRWSEEGYTQLCDTIIEKTSLKVVFVGDQEDKLIAERIRRKMQFMPVNLAGETSLAQLGAILKQASLVITNDSAPMHLASYLDVPVLAIFGASDPVRYGPWSSQCRFVKSKMVCEGCLDPKKGIHTCMKNLSVQEVLHCLEMSSSAIRIKK